MPALEVPANAVLSVGVANRVHHGRQGVDAAYGEIRSTNFESIDVQDVKHGIDVFLWNVLKVGFREDVLLQESHCICLKKKIAVPWELGDLSVSVAKLFQSIFTPLPTRI